MVGHEAATLVAEMGVAISNELTVESIHDTIHAHPNNCGGMDGSGLGGKRHPCPSTAGK